MEKHRPPGIVKNLTGTTINFLVRGAFNADVKQWVRADKTIYRATTEKEAQDYVRRLLLPTEKPRKKRFN